MGRRTQTGKFQHSHPRGSRGAAVVEFALVLPVLVMLMLGVVTFGLAYDQKLALTNGVREGGRFGASLPASGTWVTQVQDRTTQVLFSSSDPTGLVVCAKLVDSLDTVVYSGSCGIAASEPPLPDDVEDGDCVVKVWASRPATLNILVAKWEITLAAQSVSFYERTPCGEPPP